VIRRPILSLLQNRDFTQDQLTGGSIAGHVSAKFKKQRAASRDAGNELQNPL
jgi:hypothetical protein